MSAAEHVHAVPGFEQKTTRCFARLAYQTEGSMKRGWPVGVAEKKHFVFCEFTIQNEL